MIIHTHTKFAPLDFINKKSKGNPGYFTQTEHPLWLNKKVKFLNSVILKDIELKFGMETNIGLLNSKSNITSN